MRLNLGAWRCVCVELCLAEEYPKRALPRKNKTTQMPLNDGNYTEQPFMELTVSSICHGSCLNFQIKVMKH